MSAKLSSNVLRHLLAAFFAMCAQAHLTDKLTPAFALMVADSLPDLNEKAFGFLGVTDDTFNYILMAINVFLVSVLVPRRTKRLGLLSAVGFLSLGFWGDIATNAPILPHVILISTAVTALTLTLYVCIFPYHARYVAKL